MIPITAATMAPTRNDEEAVVLPRLTFTTSVTLPSPHILPCSRPFFVPPFVVNLFSLFFIWPLLMLPPLDVRAGVTSRFGPCADR
jgi:hypothetical protein